MCGAFMLNWLDLDEAVRGAFEEWHNREHVAERLAIPGFIEGRRYRSIDAAPRVGHSWLIAYDVVGLDVLRSQGYALRLNEPTAATRAMVPHLQHVIRTAYEIAAVHDVGLGTFMTTIRLPADRISVERLEAVLAETAGLTSITRVRLGRPDFDASRFKDATEEGRFTNASRASRYPWCLTVEASGREGLEAATDHLAREASFIGFDIRTGAERDSYQLVFVLRRRPAAAATE
jgi:hypothetical protein